MESTEIGSLPSASEIREKLKAKELRDLQPEIKLITELLSSFTSLTEQEIVNTLFQGDFEWAEGFLNLIRQRPGIQVLRSPTDARLILKIPSQNQASELLTLIYISPEQALEPEYVESLDVAIGNPATGQAVLVKSLLPPDDHRTISTVLNTGDGEINDELVEAFYTGEDVLQFSEIHNHQEWTWLLHEIGHIWEDHLKIMTDDELNSLGRSFDFTFDELRQTHGDDVSVATANAVGFGERLANVIGRIIDAKVKKTGMWEETYVPKFADNSDHGSTYDTRHLPTHLDIFDRIKSSLTSRFNRSKEGERQHHELQHWIEDQLNVVNSLFESIKEKAIDSDLYGLNIKTKQFSDRTTQINGSISLIYDQDNNVSSARIHYTDLDEEVNLSISKFEGITLDENSEKARPLEIKVGNTDSNLILKQETFKGKLNKIKLLF
jgi:hypothetical protein